MKFSQELLAQAAEAFREAATTEISARMSLVATALGQFLGMARDTWIDISAFYPDRVVMKKREDGRLYAYPYSVSDDNQVTFGEASEVVQDHVPANEIEGAAVAMVEALGGGSVFVEAEESSPGRYLVRVIRAGRSGNGVDYPREVLREAVELFEGVQVFVKGDQEHLRGGGKDFRQLVGRLTEPRFVESDPGEIQAILEVLETHAIAPTLREAVERGMTDLFGLSIDALGRSKKKGKFREAQSLRRVNSVDLIIEPGAGGQVLRFIEALNPTHKEDDTMKQRMIEAIKKRRPDLLDGLDQSDEDAVLAAFQEAIADENNDAGDGNEGALTGAQIDQRIDARTRMIEARAYARTTISSAQLPKQARDKLQAEFDGRERFTEAQVDEAIEAEREYLKGFKEARIEGLGGTVEAGQDRSEKVTEMLDDFFDPDKPNTSFRECYIQITGDRGVTGIYRDCDLQRLREARGGEFREAISSTTFSEILGDSIARAMVREYSQDPMYQDWRDLVDVVPVSDFRTQRRTRVGGYANLPAVGENDPYTALTTPGDEDATYAVSKRGGTETMSIEAISNDDVGLITRIPRSLGQAAARTLYEFVLDFLDGNPTIYDSVALFHASHNNLGTAALSAASWAARRLAMKQQTQADSGKRIGLIARHLYIPSDLEETAYDLYVRNTNNDENFVQSTKPTVHVVPHWTDANNWYATASKRDVQLIELAFYNGQETPEIFVQDNPTQGSLFSNDQLKWKISHMYGGNVIDFRGFDGSIVA